MRETIESSFSRERMEKPKVKFMITRHAERLPSGELSPEGLEHARRKGEGVKEGGTEVFKAYVSDHKSGRAFDTGDMISKASEITSEFSRKQYRTHTVPDIQYDILKPDLAKLIPQAKDIIEEATLRELGMSTARDEKGKLKIDMEKLPLAEQERIAPVRQRNQRFGFEFFLRNDAAVERLAMGLAHQLARELALTREYLAMRGRAGKPLKGDLVLNTVSHGMFLESLLKKAGVRVFPEGRREESVANFESPDFGGYIEPGESIALVVEDPANLPKEIPVEFEKTGRPTVGRVFIDTERLLELNRKYEEWKKAVKE